MTKLLFIIIAFLLSSRCFPQADSVFHFVKDYRGGISDFTVDNLGNLYFVYQNGQLKKLRPNGDSLAVFNNVRKFGKLYIRNAGEQGKQAARGGKMRRKAMIEKHTLVCERLKIGRGAQFVAAHAAFIHAERLAQNHNHIGARADGIGCRPFRALIRE